MSTRKPRILILGGGYAGLHLARRLAHPAMPSADIVLLDASDHWRERIRLHQLAAGQALPLYSYRRVLQPLGVGFIHAQVEAIQPGGRKVFARAANGASLTLDYDYLALALGSRLATPSGLEELLPLDTGAQAEAIHQRLQNRPDARVLIAGAGLSGLECAFELAETWPRARVTLADAGELRPSQRPGGWSAKAVHYLREAAGRLSIDWRSNAKVLSSQRGVATFACGAKQEFDLGLLSAGFVPPRLIAASGLSVSDRGLVLAGSDLSCEGYPEIVAIGDCAAISTPQSGPLRMSCAAALPAAIGAANTLSARMQDKPAPEFRFQYMFRNVSIGRYDGLVQFVDARDVPTRTIWKGNKAAEWKEFICRTTVAELGLAAIPKMPHCPPLVLLPRLQSMERFYAEPGRGIPSIRSIR